MPSKAKTVKQYLNDLPADRREALEAVRKVILENLGEGFEEGIQYGMIGYFVPHSVYPPGYHCDKTQPLPFASIAAQKNHMAIYLFCIYCEPITVEWFQESWAKEKAKGNAGKLDMGKSCVRFKKIEDVPLNVVGKTIKRMPVKKFVSFYEGSFGPSAKTSKKAATKKTASKKTKKKTIKKAAAKKTTKKSSPRVTKKTAAKKAAGKKAAGRKRVAKR